MDLQLDPAQRSVVDHDGGPLLVLGSPGTGKTTVLVERWVRLATQSEEPHRILLLVPTRDRALVLRDELPWRLPQAAIIEAPVHTWHAFAYHLVTRYYGKLGYAAPPVRLTTAEQWAVCKQLLGAEKSKDWGGFADHLGADAFVSEVADFCVRAGHRGLSDDDLTELAARRPEHAAVAHFCLRYRTHLKETATLDYAELVAAATRLLDLDDDIRATVAQRFTHVLVDDAQELAPAQLQLLRRLNTAHLVCAGDPDSAIEAFRGADPSWLEQFDDVAPGHQRVVLPTCHRFGKAIGDVTMRLMEHAPYESDHRATTFDGPADGHAELRCFATMAGELEGAARELRTAHLLQRIPYDRMAVLLAQPGAYGHILERTLTEFGVPYRVASADSSMGAEPSVRAVLDMCRLALQLDEGNDLCKAVLSSQLIGMHPYRVRDLERKAYLGKSTLLDVVSTDESDEAAELRALRDAATAHAHEPADATFAAVFDASQWCKRLVSTRRTDHDAAHHIDALVALGSALAHFAERRPGGSMREYLESSADAGVAAETWTPSDTASGVHVLSFHRSKGLEWDVVCVLGVAEGQMPKAHRAQGLFDPWALDAGTAIDRAQAQLAEERRTFYVALSRARERLVVSTSPGVRRSVPSRFCDEAFGSLPDTITPGADAPPVTLGEAVASYRRTLASARSDEAMKKAAAAALARIDGLDPADWWWRRDWTPGNALTPEGKLTTSYSRIGRYDECPLRYVLESVLGLDPQSTYQMKFGSLVHMIIERSDPAKGDITKWEDALAIYKTEFVEHHKDDYPNEVFARTYYRYGVQSLKRWWRSERSTGETIEVEYSFDDLDFDGHTIRGRIDRVAKVGPGLVLSDYKTSRNAIAWQEAKDSLQLAIYYKAAKVYDNLKEHGEPRSMQLVYPGIKYEDPRDNSIGCAKRYQNPEEAEEALARLHAILENAAHEEFAPSPEADCRWCHMKPLCPRWPEGKEIPR
jgi:superfamily I DNA/RNA helicase/RecB family exonuclease